MPARGNAQTARQILSLLRRINIPPQVLILPVALSVLAALLEGTTMMLLLPVLEGFLRLDFSFIKEQPVLGTVLEWLPPSVSARDRTLFLFLMALLVTAVLTKNILRFAGAASMTYVISRASHHLRKHVFERYLQFGKLYFDRTNVGHHSTVLSDFTKSAFSPILNLEPFLSALFTLLVYFGVMFYISWQLTLIALPALFVINLAVRRIIVAIRQQSRLAAKNSQELGKKVIEILSLIPLVKSMNMEKNEREHYNVISDRKSRLEFRVSVLQQAIRPLQESIMMGAVLLLLFGMMQLMLNNGTAMAPSFIVYFYLIHNAASKFGVLVATWGHIASSAGSVEEVVAVFEDEDKVFVPDGDVPFKGLQREIEFKSLHFSYADGTQALRDVSFRIKKGQTVAIVGVTGSGKTTISSLLLRFYDSPAQTIFIDDTDIRSFLTNTLRDHMALVSQETLLLNDTLRANIAYGAKQESEQELREAVEKAGLSSFVRGLPNGLDTIIGDRGVQLSGGEKQRVAIARALLRDAEILLLDEATSALDSKTEQLVQQSIEEAKGDRTVLIIAHRLATIRNADYIVVLEQGRSVEQGTLDELLKAKGPFYELWTRQQGL